jgi:hypothetical protein
MLDGGAAMRPTRCTSLVILWLLAGATVVHADGRTLKKVVRPAAPWLAPAQRAKPPSKEPEIIWSRMVDGWGETEADAKQMALENARRELLRAWPLEWKPNLSYITKKLIKGNGERLEDTEEPLKGWQGARLSIEIDRGTWEDMLQKDRQVRSESRLLFMGKFLAGMIAFLGAVAGYLRLEELTKGYYTAWLRLAAIGFVSVVGAGIWWIS